MTSNYTITLTEHERQLVWMALKCFPHTQKSDLLDRLTHLDPEN